MFCKNFVASIRSNGRFFREDNDCIRIPYGSEYSVYLKNLESRKAVVKISIDGKDVLSGNRIIVDGNSALDLEGYLDGTTGKNKFKFVEMTDAIEKHRGITPEDGLITIEFQYEKEQVCKPEYYYHYYYYNWWTYPQYSHLPPTITISGTFSDKTYESGCHWGASFSDSGNSLSRGGGGSSSSSYCLNGSQQKSFSNNDVGITVPGSDIEQKFYAGYTRELENKVNVMTFRLLGYNPEEETKSVFANDKITCSTCGKKSKNFQKFCDQCGTRL